MELEIITDPKESAKAAGLRYMSDSKPGITRQRTGDTFEFFLPDGSRIEDGDDLERIKALAIPPAWTDVWICPSPRGHIQVTARDARNRKQYRYHAKWRAARDETKYARMVHFGESLPVIRMQVEDHLALPGFPREKIVAAIVSLLDKTLIRVGNEEYARENKHYGLTTLLNRHVDVKGTTLKFHFRAKSGVYRKLTLKDKRLASVVRKCQQLPGQELFGYLDEAGEPHSISSDDVNSYLREITGEDFTAKDFRTWAGTVYAACELQAMESGESQEVLKKNILNAIKNVSERLGNTPAICRKCYVHPIILEKYASGELLILINTCGTEKCVEGLTTEEGRVLEFLRVTHYGS